MPIDKGGRMNGQERLIRHNPLFKSRLEPEKKSLLLMLSAVAALCGYRAYNLWATGYLVTDEYRYIADAMQGQIYGGRFFFGGLNVLLFHLLGLQGSLSVSFVVFLALYLFLWNSITVYAFYKVMRLLKFDNRTMVLSFFSSMFVISFILLSLGFLTEPVGLAMTMLGIYFFVRYALHEGRSRYLLIYPLIASLAFSAARYTREPYSIFLIGGIVGAVMIGRNHHKRIVGFSEKNKTVLVTLSVLCFVIPSIFFLQYPNSLTAEVGTLFLGFGQMVSQPVVTNVTTTTVTSLSTYLTTVIRTSMEIVTQTIVSGTHTVMQVTTLTHTSSLTSTASTVVENAVVSTNPILNSRLANTAYIFVGGLILGWGPIMFVVGLWGSVLVISRANRTRNIGYLVVLLAVVLAAGSYLFVSYIFAVDPTYLTLQHYSTIIRFSDTSLPCFFLAAPFAFSFIARKRLYVVIYLVLLLVFSAFAISAYPVYITSNLSNLGVQGDPFLLNYISPGVYFRDYVSTHQSGVPFYVVGPFQATWWWAPKSQLVNDSVQIFQQISQQEFTSMKWHEFYIFGYDTKSLVSQMPFLSTFIRLNQSGSNFATPYRIESDQLLFNDSGYLIQVQLSWGQ